MQTQVWCENSSIGLWNVYEMFRNEGGWRLFRCQILSDFSQLFKLILQMLIKSWFYVLSLFFISFSRWRFTFYFSIFFYGIRFLWTVSCSVTHAAVLCGCSWMIPDLGSWGFYSGPFLHCREASVQICHFGNNRKLFDMLPQNFGKNKVALGFSLLWRAAPFYLFPSWRDTGSSPWLFIIIRAVWLF